MGEIGNPEIQGRVLCLKARTRRRTRSGIIEMKETINSDRIEIRNVVAV